MRKLLRIGAPILIFSLFVTACATGGKALKSTQEGDIRCLHRDGWKPYPPEKPDWVTHRGKYSTDQYLAFVGISQPMTSEALAEKDAYKDVVDKISAYVQTTSGSKVDQVLLIKGLASEVLDPATKEEIAIKQINANKISKAYTRERFVQQCQEFRNGAWSKTSYKAYVLVLYPKTEIERIHKRMIEEQQRKIREEMAKAQNEQKRKLLEEADRELEKLKSQGF